MTEGEYRPPYIPEIPKTAKYPLEVVTNIETYQKHLTTTMRYGDRTPEKDRESRYAHLEKHGRDYKRQLKVDTVAEAIVKLGEILAKNEEHNLHFIDMDTKRQVVWDPLTEMAVIVDTEPLRRKDTPPPPPPVIVTAYRCSKYDIDAKVKGELRGSLWRAATDEDRPKYLQ